MFSQSSIYDHSDIGQPHTSRIIVPHALIGVKCPCGFQGKHVIHSYLLTLFDSSEFRELKKYQRDFSSWCGECLLRKKERSRRLSSAKRQLASW